MTDGGDFDGAEFKPPTAGGSVTVDDSAVESDPEPPVKKTKANSAAKGKAKIVEPKVELPKEPKPKKKLLLFRDEINIAAKEFEEVRGKKFGAMMKSMRGKNQKGSQLPSQAHRGLRPSLQETRGR
ncbi:hypothetical protein PILCRDRAFT_16634 [Piloderma croceum F 1598]|uniref:Uncharacterized protein n=1 Tax=Piloderma croceum (strain F 1598) TaxID=765440 RepID=A0A0C3EGT1_PILCF|nr:hypothetical protein PILCRDRAFT_16634 [Piloderma croceum F 1598]